MRKNCGNKGTRETLKRRVHIVGRNKGVLCFGNVYTNARILKKYILFSFLPFSCILRDEPKLPQTVHSWLTALVLKKGNIFMNWIVFSRKLIVNSFLF